MDRPDDFLLRYPEPVRERAMELDALLRKALPGITATVDTPGGLIGYAYGPGYKETICTLIPSKKGVKLGFYKGSELPDPLGLLGGSGKVHRTVEVPMNGPFPMPGLKELLAAALKAYQERGQGLIRRESQHQLAQRRTMSLTR